MKLEKPTVQEKKAIPWQGILLVAILLLSATMMIRYMFDGQIHSHKIEAQNGPSD